MRFGEMGTADVARLHFSNRSLWFAPGTRPDNRPAQGNGVRGQTWNEPMVETPMRGKFSGREKQEKGERRHLCLSSFDTRMTRAEAEEWYLS